jgi:hypothetical protein
VIQPTAAPDGRQVASWLEAHHVRYGQGGYWQRSIITVDSGGQGQVRATVGITAMEPYLRLAKSSWYDPARNLLSSS